MPLPEPQDDETEDEWMDRCMANDTMNEEYPDDSQRYAVCADMWENKDDDSGDNAMSDKLERRHAGFDQLELREEGEGPGTLEGHAAVFNEDTFIDDLLGGFNERIEPGAFADVLGDDIRGLFNHNPDHLLGRTEAGTLELKEDDTGLWMQLELPDTPIGRQVATSVKRGDITGQSFSFMVAEQSWHENDNEDEPDLRVIHKYSRVDDVGPVTFPAYEATDIDVAEREHRARIGSGEDGKSNPSDDEERGEEPDDTDNEEEPEEHDDTQEDENARRRKRKRRLILIQQRAP